MSQSKQNLSASIGDLFFQCSNSSGLADFKSIAKNFWCALDNSLSLIDIVGLYTLACNGQEKTDSLDINMFAEFLSGSARVKYSSGNDTSEKLVDVIRDGKTLKVAVDSPSFSKIIEKNTLKALLKYDIPLKRVFSAFSGKDVRLGAGLTWNEVKNRSVGMDLDGFASFCGTYGIIPRLFNILQANQYFRDTLESYPLVASSSSLNSTILFPQFQIIICLLAFLQHDNQLPAGMKTLGSAEKGFAKKVTSTETKSSSDIVHEFLRDIGIEKLNEHRVGPHSPVHQAISAPLELSLSPKNVSSKSTSSTNKNGQDLLSNLSEGIAGIGLIMPSSHTPQDPYLGGSLEHRRQAMMMRVDLLLEEVNHLAREILTTSKGAAYLEQYGQSITYLDNGIETKNRMASKPVVIADSVPLPRFTPDIVEQLLQAALAHHNLGNGEEALKFLEAARLQVVELVKKLSKPKEEPDPDISEKLSLLNDLLIYIIMCKGNVYQTCGDDEQSIIAFFEGYRKSQSVGDKNWSMLFVNAMGLIAYYNVHYQVAALCFCAVLWHRIQIFGEESADTGTTYNNEGCALYCLQHRGEARSRFEKAWDYMCNTLGHRAPRSLVVWKNLEKSRRSQTSHRTLNELTETVSRRDDAEHLLMGGSFVVKALPPPDEGGKKKKKKKGGGGKKKKK